MDFGRYLVLTPPLLLYDLHYNTTPSTELVFQREKVTQSAASELENLDVDVYNQADLEQAVSNQASFTRGRVSTLELSFLFLILTMIIGNVC